MSSNQQLTGQQYELVLKYMQAANQQEFDRAVQVLKNHQFNLQVAINSRFSGDEPVQGQNLVQPQNQIPNRNANNVPNNQQQVRRYIEFLREKQNRSVLLGIYNFTKNIFCGLFSGLSQLLLPQFIKKKVIRSPFYNNYVDDFPFSIKDKSLSQLLKNNYFIRKPIMFLVGDYDKKNECFIALMNNQRIARKIKQSFIISGANHNTQNGQSTLHRFAPLEETQISIPPSIIIVRETLLQQSQIIHRFVGPEQIANISIQTLNLILRAYQYQHRKDRNTLIRYRNHVRRQYYGARPGFYQQEDDQQEQYGLLDNEVQVNAGRRSSIDNSAGSFLGSKANTSTMIQQQNQQYRQLQKITKQKQMRESEEMRKQQQVEEQRKFRKMSIPDQPLQGDDIFRINFRCPDGAMLTRNFLGDEKVDLLYQWVETNSNIQFEDNVKRSFELLHSFPPTPLCDKRQQYLKDVFDSDQEKLMIREL